MGIDLDTSKGRKQYLSEKLDDLLAGINDSYGVVLMEELLCRLELAIKDFNDEMKTLCDQLIKKQEERQHLLEILKTNESIPPQVISKKSTSSNDDEIQNTDKLKQVDGEDGNHTKEFHDDIPDWEKKLSKLEKK